MQVKLDGNKPFSSLSRARQLTETFCGPATIQMLLSHYGIEVHQQQVVEAAGVQATVEIHGIPVEELGRAVRKLAPEMKFWVKRFGTITELKKIVREYNYPVGVDWQGIFEIADEYDKSTGYVGVTDEALAEAGYSYDSNDGEHGHYSVVVDVDTNENYIQIADPYGHYAEKDRFIRLQEFSNRWWDEDIRVDSWTGKKKVTDECRTFFVIVPANVTFPEEMGMSEV
jgi:hypothetical protein